MKHLLDIPQHDPRAFLPAAGRMKLYGGKSDPPSAPDYVGQAHAQAAGSLNAARSQTQANRIDQVTPYGSMRYTQGDGFDQAGFDEAMRRYKDQERGLQENPQVREYMREIGTLIEAPNRNEYMTNPDQWRSEIVLSDTGRQLLDAYNRTSLGMADLQDSAMGRVRDTFAQPFDTSGIPGTQYGVDMAGLPSLVSNVDSATGMDAWDKYSGLLMQRMNPELDAQQASLDTKLANQGLTAGSEGWGLQQQQFGKQRNDANIAAQLAGAGVQQQFFGQALQNAGLSNSARGQAFGERASNVQMNNSGRAQELQSRATLRQMPLNELNALRAGSQVANPSFNTPGEQSQTSGPDLLGATQGQYNNQVGQVNAQNAQAQANTQAGVGAASIWGSLYGAGAVSFF